jgi:hypothetical protein
MRRPAKGYKTKFIATRRMLTFEKHLCKQEVDFYTATVSHNPTPQIHSGEKNGRFDATQWKLVLRAKDESTTAINSLFTCYREPLFGASSKFLMGINNMEAPACRRRSKA